MKLWSFPVYFGLSYGTVFLISLHLHIQLPWQRVGRLVTVLYSGHLVLVLYPCKSFFGEHWSLLWVHCSSFINLCSMFVIGDRLLWGFTSVHCILMMYCRIVTNPSKGAQIEVLISNLPLILMIRAFRHWWGRACHHYRTFLKNM